MATFKVNSIQDPNVSFEVEGKNEKEALYNALNELGYSLVKKKE